MVNFFIPFICLKFAPSLRQRKAVSWSTTIMPDYASIPKSNSIGESGVVSPSMITYALGSHNWSRCTIVWFVKEVPVIKEVEKIVEKIVYKEGKERVEVEKVVYKPTDVGWLSIKTLYPKNIPSLIHSSYTPQEVMEFQESDIFYFINRILHIIW